jgi:hypothetical protein
MKKVLAAVPPPDMSIVGVPTMARFVVFMVLNRVPPNAGVILIFPVPKSIVLTLELLLIKVTLESVKLLSLSVPAVSVTVPPDAFAVRDTVKSDLLIVITAHAAVDSIETIAAVPLFASNSAVSAARGGPTPATPPDNKDQFAVLLLFQVPDPPTQ